MKRPEWVILTPQSLGIFYGKVKIKKRHGQRPRVNPIVMHENLKKKMFKER